MIDVFAGDDGGAVSEAVPGNVERGECLVAAEPFKESPSTTIPKPVRVCTHKSHAWVYHELFKYVGFFLACVCVVESVAI